MIHRALTQRIQTPFIAKIHPLSLHDKQQMCGMAHKDRLDMWERSIPQPDSIWHEDCSYCTEFGTKDKALKSIVGSPISRKAHVLDELTEGSEPLGHTLFQDRCNIRDDVQRFQTLPHTSCFRPSPPKPEGGGDWCTDIVETSNWFSINNAIPSHGLK